VWHLGLTAMETDAHAIVMPVTEIRSQDPEG
jgi:hypothetical protein